MRVRVTGNLASGLVSLLLEAGIPVTEHLPAYHVDLSVGRVSCPVVDGVDCELERHVINFIAELSPSGRVLLHRAGGVQSDQAVKVTVPDTIEERHAATLGLVRALLQYRHRRQPYHQRLLLRLFQKV